ncbi:MAG: hypothetical protein ABSG13_08930 [Bryobacteraceae bacterium]|jgi:hypothetical protein
MSLSRSARVIVFAIEQPDEQQDQIDQPLSFGFRSAANFIAAIYHCCARMPLPAER